MDMPIPLGKNSHRKLHFGWGLTSLKNSEMPKFTLRRFWVWITSPIWQVIHVIPITLYTYSDWDEYQEN